MELYSIAEGSDGKGLRAMIMMYTWEKKSMLWKCLIVLTWNIIWCKKSQCLCCSFRWFPERNHLSKPKKLKRGLSRQGYNNYFLIDTIFVPPFTHNLIN